MARNLYLSGFHSPVYGETLSSWISRGVKTDARFRKVQEYIRPITVDIDSSLSTFYLAKIADLLNITVAELRTLCYNTWECISIPSRRRFFCWHCCVSDLIRRRTVVIYRLWGLPWVCGCPIHRCRLGILNGSIENISTKIVDVILDDPATLECVIQDLKSTESFGSGPRGYSGRRVDPVIEIGLATQEFFMRIFCSNSCAEHRLDAQCLLMEALKLILRKRVRYFESGGILNRLERGARYQWLEEKQDENLLHNTLAVEVDTFDSYIRMAALATLGYCLKIPRCVKLWQHYITFGRPYSFGLADYSPEALFSTFLHSEFVDYKKHWDDTLQLKSESAKLLFSATRGVFPHLSPWMAAVEKLHQPEVPHVRDRVGGAKRT